MTLTLPQMKLVIAVLNILEQYPGLSEKADDVFMSEITFRDGMTGHAVGVLSQEEGAWLFEPLTAPRLY